MSGFRKARKAVPIAHARVGQHGQVSVATGCAALDRLVGGGLAILQTGDRIRIDLDRNKVDVLLPEGELESRRTAWTPPKLQHMTPWEEIYRSMVGQQGTGACLEPATLYLDIIETRGESRNNH